MNENSNVMVTVDAIIEKARAEAFLDAIQIYLEVEAYPDNKVIMALASQGTIMPDPEEVRRKLSENSGGGNA